MIDIKELEQHQLVKDVSFIVWDAQKGEVVLRALVVSVDTTSHPAETLYNLLTPEGAREDCSLASYYWDPGRFRIYDGTAFEVNMELLDSLPRVPKLKTPAAA